jgi:hypothetical protein
MCVTVIPVSRRPLQDKKQPGSKMVGMASLDSRSQAPSSEEARQDGGDCASSRWSSASDPTPELKRRRQDEAEVCR